MSETISDGAGKKKQEGRAGRQRGDAAEADVKRKSKARAENQEGEPGVKEHALEWGALGPTGEATKWRSALEIERKLSELPSLDLLEKAYELRYYWAEALYPQDYKVDPTWASIVTPSSAGLEYLSLLGTACAGLAVEEVHLLAFILFYYHDIAIDWTKCDLTAIQMLLNKEVTETRVLFPHRFGRTLYDKFNDTITSLRTDHLLPDETIQFLNGTPQGVYQLGRFVSGPLGILESQESRWVPPSRELALWHCSDPGCAAVHEVKLHRPGIPLLLRLKELNGLLAERYGPRSEWGGRLASLHRTDKWPEGRPYIDLPVLIGDCIVGRERTQLLTEALVGPGRDYLRDALRRPPRDKNAGNGAAEQVASRQSTEAQLQLLLLLPDTTLVRLIDAALGKGTLAVSRNETRTARQAPRGFSYADSESELSSIGLRSVSQNPMRYLASVILYVYTEANALGQLEWHLRAIANCTPQVAVYEYIRQNGPNEAINNLVLSTQSIAERTCEKVCLTVPLSEMERSRGAELLLWKFGFDVPRYDEFAPRFRTRLERFTDSVLTAGSSMNEDERERIRAAGVNVFVSVEEFLEQLVSYNVWLLGSDHFADDRWAYDREIANAAVIRVLGDSLTAGSESEVEAVYAWHPGGDSTLGVHLRYLDEAVNWMNGLESRNRDELLRPNEDLPHFAENPLRPFLLRHRQLWADATLTELRRYIAGFSSIVKLLSQSKLASIRNGLDHKRDSSRFPDSDAMIACATRLREVFELADAGRYFPKAYWLHTKRTDRFGTVEFDFRDYRDRPLILYGPPIVAGLSVPAFGFPYVVAPSNFLGYANSHLLFTLRDVTDFSKYWSGYPRRRRIVGPPATDAAQ